MPGPERQRNAHGLIAKIPRTRRWRLTSYGRNVMGTSLYLREHRSPNVAPMPRGGLILFEKIKELTAKEPMLGAARRWRLRN